MTDNRLTAIIPTHNRLDLLTRALESVQGQSVTVEVIVVDDGSDPALSARDLPSGVSLLRSEVPRGPAAARNVGAAAAKTQWVGFLDDDDLWLPGKAESVLEAAVRFPEANVVFHGSAFQPSTRNKGLRMLDDPLMRVTRQQPPHISGVCVRRQIHDDVQFDETMWATQDLDYLIRLAYVPNWVEIRHDLSRLGDAGLEDSAISIESRIEGRLSLLDRHGDLIRGDPVAHSFFYVRLGYQYRRGGRYADARSSFLRAIKLRPTSALAWRGLIRVLFAASPVQ
ncbi:MAG: glycosyltransferase [Acidimicrobiia bacterium]